MTTMEKLARKICWLEFAGPRTKKRLGTTEARYWAGLPEESKTRYREEAGRFNWLVRELDKLKGGWLLVDGASRSDG